MALYAQDIAKAVTVTALSVFMCAILYDLWAGACNLALPATCASGAHGQSLHLRH